MPTALKFLPPTEDVKHAFNDSIDTKSYVKNDYNILTSIINYSNFEVDSFAVKENIDLLYNAYK